MHNFRTRLENLMRNERRGVLSEDDKLKQISSRAREVLHYVYMCTIYTYQAVRRIKTVIIFREIIEE